MKFSHTEIEDVILIEPQVYEDSRGKFLESYRRNVFDRHDIPFQFVQDNLSVSRKGTIRGLHYQIEKPQGKLVMVMKGKILDVAVDLRQSSSYFGKGIARILSEENRHQLFIPEGFAHGFSVLSKEALVYYKCTDYYHPEGEKGLRWNDPRLDIDWRVSDPIVSSKDQKQPLLEEINTKDLFN